MSWWPGAFTESTAVELLQHYSADAVATKIEVFDWLGARKDKRIQRSPAGYLVESIRRDYAVPNGFEPRAVREARADGNRRLAVRPRRTTAGRLRPTPAKRPSRKQPTVTGQL